MIHFIAALLTALGLTAAPSTSQEATEGAQRAQQLVMEGKPHTNNQVPEKRIQGFTAQDTASAETKPEKRIHGFKKSGTASSTIEEPQEPPLEPIKQTFKPRASYVCTADDAEITDLFGTVNLKFGATVTVSGRDTMKYGDNNRLSFDGTWSKNPFTDPNEQPSLVNTTLQYDMTDFAWTIVQEDYSTLDSPISHDLMHGQIYGSHWTDINLVRYPVPGTLHGEPFTRTGESIDIQPPIAFNLGVTTTEYRQSGSMDLGTGRTFNLSCTG